MRGRFCNKKTSLMKAKLRGMEKRPSVVARHRCSSPDLRFHQGRFFVTKCARHLLPAQREARLAFVIRLAAVHRPHHGQIVRDTFCVYNPLGFLLNEVAEIPGPPQHHRNYSRTGTRAITEMAAISERQHYPRYKAIEDVGQHQCSF